MSRALRYATLTLVLAGSVGLVAAQGGMPAVPEVAARERILEKARAAPRAFDSPDLAARHWAAKRLPGDRDVDAVALYAVAARQMREMPRHATRLGTALPSIAEAGPVAVKAAELGSWEPLGPGNIGGRTRALVVDPKKPRIAYAAGVSGGIWKTENGGGRWRPVGDLLPNIAVSVLAMDPMNSKVLYAGTGEGHFREVVRATSLPLRGAGIFKSEDAGKSWGRLERTKTADFAWVNDLVVSAVDSRRLYAATRSGVWRSRDGGKTWKRSLDPRVTGGCFDLALRTDRAADVLFAACGTFERATIHRNLEASRRDRWVPVLSEEGMGRTSLALAPSNQDVIYALAASYLPGPDGRYRGGLHAVFRSDAGGAAGSWRATVRNDDPDFLSTLLLTNPVVANLTACGFTGPNRFSTLGWYTNVIAVDPKDPEIVFAGGVDLFRSDDGGASWGPISHWFAAPPSAHADQHVVVFHPKYDGRVNQTMFLGGDGGVWRTDNARAAKASGPQATCDPSRTEVRWRALNRSYGVTQFYHGLPFPDGRGFLGGTQDNGTLRGARDRGIDGWFEIFGGDGGYVAIDPRNPNVIYVEAQGLALNKSTDGGATFTSAIAGIGDRPGGGDDVGDLLFIVPFVLDSSNPDRLWYGGRHLWRTTNGAASWTQASTPWPSGGRLSALAVSPVDPNRVVIGLDDGTIHYSADALAAGPGTAWAAVQPRAGFVSSVAFDPADPLRVYATYATFGGSHVWSSDDGGASWRPIDGAGKRGLPDLPVHVLAVDPTDGRRLFLGTDLGVFVSTARGGTWAVENSGFANVVTEALSIGVDETGRPTIYAFTHGRGAWRVPLARPR